MQARNCNIADFLNERKIFIIPVYQRNYDWQKDNCIQLFYDIINIIDSDKEHFLGTICFKSNNAYEYYIIDGQQRLASIMILLKALHDFSDGKSTQKEIQEEINNEYLYFRNYDNINKDAKIRFNKGDNNIYSIILKHNNGDIKQFLNIDQQESNIYKNYSLFYDLIGKYVNEEGSNSEKCIIDALKKLTIVELEIQQEKPQEIFESINSTGRELTTVDLIRNYLLMQLPYKDQEKLYDDYWSEIEETIGLDYMEQLMVDYLILKKQSNTISINKSVIHINSRTLYTIFKYYYQTKLEGETCY